MVIFRKYREYRQLKYFIKSPYSEYYSYFKPSFPDPVEKVRRDPPGDRALGTIGMRPDELEIWHKFIDNLEHIRIRLDRAKV